MTGWLRWVGARLFQTLGCPALPCPLVVKVGAVLLVPFGYGLLVAGQRSIRVFALPCLDQKQRNRAG